MGRTYNAFFTNWCDIYIIILKALIHIFKICSFMNLRAKLYVTSLLLKIMLVCVMLSAFSKSAFAATYFVSFGNSGNSSIPVGSDGNSKTQAQNINTPWKTIQHAADNIDGGDTVYIRAGTYNEGVHYTNKTRTAEPYTTFAAYNGEKVIVDGTGIKFDSSSQEGLVYFKESDYIRISGLTVQNANMAGIYVSYADHIKIDNNITHNTLRSGISVWGSSTVVIEYNNISLANCGTIEGEDDHQNPVTYKAYECPNQTATPSEEFLSVDSCNNVDVRFNTLHDGARPYTNEIINGIYMGLPPARAGGEGLNIKSASYNVRVYNNEVYNLPSKLGIAVDAWGHYLHDVDIYNNIVHDNGVGFLPENEENCILDDNKNCIFSLAENIRLYNNIGYNNKTACVHVPNYSSPAREGPKKNFYFYNNTCYNNDTSIRISSNQVENMVFKNNIFFDKSTSPIDINSAMVPQTFIENNIIWTNSGTVNLPSNYPNNIKNNIIADPLYIDPTNAAHAQFPNFRLQSTSSPAYDKAISITAVISVPAKDYDNFARPWGTKSDIGAFEYHNGQATPATPTTELIGDFDHNGTVNYADIAVFRQNYGNSTCGNVADANDSCSVDLIDLAILIKNYGVHN